MCRTLAIGMILALVATSLPAMAELEEVQVGGQLRVRFRTYENNQNGPRGAGPGGSILRVPAAFVPDRPIGATGLFSRFRYDDRGNDRHYAELQTRLNVKANFTSDVAAFIQLESVEVWGEDFRSNYVTGADGITATDDDVEVLQSYIEAAEMFGYPLRLRVGRQFLKMGKGWLVGNQNTGLQGLSFDAVRLTYEADTFEVDAWWSKLADTSPLEEDGDVDFYGIYGTYTGMEALKLSAYWMFVRDGRSLNDTDLVWFLEWGEDLFDVDDYDVTNLHTVGLRAFGESGAFDYDLELAYQFGDAHAVGVGFAPTGWLYGDDSADYDSWAGDLELGYTFDVMWQPRVFLGGGYYSGEDNRDISFWEWVVSPLNGTEASVSFNRLFANSSAKYSFILDGGQVLTNFSVVRLGVECQPLEKLSLGFEVEKFWVNEPFDMPVSFSLGRYRVPIAPALSFWTEESDDDLGIQTTIYGKYNYSEDLWVKSRWEHLFSGDGVDDGNFVDRYGLYFLSGTDHDDADYVELVVGVQF